MKLEIEARSRTITEYFVEVDGVNFDVEDLIETLGYIKNNDNIYVDNPRMSKVLVRIGVLESGGSMTWPASPGPKFDEFYDSLRKECEKMNAIGFEISY